jgi:hypothetical protein
VTGPRYEMWSNADHGPDATPRPMLLIAGLLIVAALVSVAWLCTAVTV